VARPALTLDRRGGRLSPMRVVFVCLIALVAAARAAAAQDAADAEAPTPLLNKLTVAFYDFSSGTLGYDLNLRHTFASSTAWIGGYRQNDGFEQARAGYEYDYHHRWLTLIPSAQAATHGFLGATIYSEVGRPFFAIAGAGRTNLQPYWNLGFDPNDYIELGGGYRDRRGNTASIYAIHDNRRHTGQTNTHTYLRKYLPHDWRLTLDAVRERGTGDNGIDVSSWALSADVDWRRWFLRVAEDPHVNYTADRQLRVASGWRF
jgi:hypothetical protein